MTPVGWGDYGYVSLTTGGDSMSLENLKEYAQRCANEPELRETAKTIG